jgi:spermidine/putrescine transport system permease protein
VPDIGSTGTLTERPTSRKTGRRDRTTSDRRSGAWYPRWFWPSFTVGGTVWVLVLFLVPFYVVFSVAFGSVDAVFRSPVPYYAPWWWSFSTFNQTLSKFYGDTAIYQPALLRTFAYVFTASVICLFLGYAVAYYAARCSKRYKGLILLLLVSPLWISYLMRIYAWQGLLEVDGPVSILLGPFGLGDVNWLEGMHVTVILGLVYGYIPFMILPIYASLDRIQESLLEAGRDLGASGRQTFWRVTLPLSRPAILAGIVIVSLPMFGDYYTNDLLSNNPRTSMLGNLIALQREAAGGSTQMASLVLILSVIVLVPMAYYLRETRRASERGA